MQMIQRQPHEEVAWLDGFDQLSRQRALALPLLCFIAGHRPLAFLAGQLLYVVEPLAGLLGQQGWRSWAALLSEPGGPDLLMQVLAQSTQQALADDELA
jgi:hypothetical protein